MGLSRKTVIAKMQAELQWAEEDTEDDRAFTRRMERIHLLSELFLEDAGMEKSGKDPKLHEDTPDSGKVHADSERLREQTEMRISEAERRVMINGAAEKRSLHEKDRKAVEDDANGDSIFDF